MGFIQQGLSDLPLHTRQADVEASLEEISAVSQAEIDFGLDGRATGITTFRWLAASAMALSRLADQAAAKSCSGLAPIRAEPGVESLMSRRPSELREAPCSRPPVVMVLAVWRTFACGSWRILFSLITR